ncbi:hypothetical protein ACFFOM_02595 [Microlunatus capsulatus]|uniref:Major facilitator superfamily (MFS) profile domain-containing protein n=1 Tax=Microlunatus capsulatus TaxID=99117 RepID=A0ABS4Z320_9ACTN|nr:hypothetical protein [Microlunatus capsulatus]MBP2415386.1 hypothetical protein [Microlunatus capsulatus]
MSADRPGAGDAVPAAPGATEGRVLRHGVLVLGLAVLAGALGGAVLGALTVALDALTTRSSTTWAFDALVAAAAGAVVGAVVATPTSLVWMLLADGGRPRPRLARAGSGVTAALAVLVLAQVLVRGIGWFAVVCAVVAALVAAAAGPALGYRRRRR